MSEFYNMNVMRIKRMSVTVVPVDKINEKIAVFWHYLPHYLFRNLWINHLLSVGNGVSHSMWLNRDEIQDRENGMLVVSNDEKSLKLGLMGIIDKRQIFNQNKLGYNAVHSISEHIAELIAIYQSQVEKFKN